MKNVYKILFNIIIFCLLCNNVNSQNVICKNTIIDNDTITLKIFVYKYPTTEKETIVLFDELSSEIKFKDDTWDELNFWLYIYIINKFNIYGDDYKQGSEKLIEQMNNWIDDIYGIYSDF